MNIAAGLLFWTAGFCPSLQQEFQPGPMIVQVEKAPHYRKPPPPRKRAGYLKKKQKVQAVALVKRIYIQVKWQDGSSSYVPRSALIPADQYQDAPGNEEEMMALKAEGYEAGRFDPETEKEFIKQKGPAMKAAYAELDRWMARLPARDALESSLTRFRRDGKLGEFSPVK